jgi:hypothetical protein
MPAMAKILLNSAILLAVMVLCAVVSTAQSGDSLRFYGHTLGESAEIFLSTAKMADSGTLTRDYCRKLLDDGEAMKRYEASRTGPNKKDFLLSDIPGCKDVMAALRGSGVPVGARFASELAEGGVVFADGKLVGFELDVKKPFADVAADVRKRLGSAGRENDTPHKGGHETKGMVWNVNGIYAYVFEIPYSETTHINLGYVSYLSKPARTVTP